MNSVRALGPGREENASLFSPRELGRLHVAIKRPVFVQIRRGLPVERCICYTKARNRKCVWAETREMKGEKTNYYHHCVCVLGYLYNPLNFFRENVICTRMKLYLERGAVRLQHF